MQWLFEHFPMMEILARIVYKKALELGILKNRIVPNEKAKAIEKVNINDLKKNLIKAGIKKGDVLIVHSSMKGIRGFEMAPEEIISYLKDLVGEEGMLLMPAYPQYPDSVTKMQYNEVYSETYEYDVNNTASWTGLITNLFWKGEDVTRSHYPNNTLSAWGKNSTEIFREEMRSDLAFDKYSAWSYCVERSAKVLFLGIHAHHALSEIHIAEDFLDEKWPIKGWYTQKRYRIIRDGDVVEKVCRVRKAFWTKYMTEYYGCYRLRKRKLLREGKVGNINYSVIPDLCEFEKYVEDCAIKGDLLYFRVPGKYYKKNSN